ncbi:MAG: redoxin domain-containing protein [Pseudomonadota bacterium]
MKLFRLIFIVVVGIFLIQSQALCQAVEPGLGFSLPMPEDTKAREYLGLTSGKTFTLGQIRAEVVIVQIYSMYCPICQREVVDVNTMFNLTQENPALSDRIRFVGIGAGNSSYEVDFYKNKYDVRFPLFSDADFSIHKQIKEVRTPHFYGLRLGKDNNYKVFYSKSGEVEDPKIFLDTLLVLSGIDLSGTDIKK